MNRVLSDPRLLLAREWSEAALQRAVIEAAKMQGWLVYHARPGMMRSGKWATPTQGNPGLPDLIMVEGKVEGRPRDVLFIELKADRGKVSPDQQRWLDALKEAGQDVRVWRPSDWLNGEILETLRREAP